LLPGSLIALSRPQAKHGLLGHISSLLSLTIKRVKWIILILSMCRRACTRKRVHRCNVCICIERVVEAIILIQFVVVIVIVPPTLAWG
jgi:hypothetical protein